MQTMHPSIMIGSYAWAQDRLPADEFRLRLDDIHADMDRNGWAGLLVYGDAREHAALAYVSNFIPRMRWGMALLPRRGEPRLLCSMSSRDIPAMRTMTWIAEVHSGWEWDKSIDPWLNGLSGAAPATLATVGFDLMAPVLYGALARSLGTRFHLVRGDDRLTVPPRRKRAREVSLIRDACTVLTAGAEAFVKTWRDTGAAESGALAGERIARRMAAQDVRTLVSLDGGRTLVPFQGLFKRGPGPLVGYLAVKLAGYWADMLLTVDDDVTPAMRAAGHALDRLLAQAGAGTPIADLYTVAARAIEPLTLHPALNGSIGRAIGLSLHEPPEFRPTENAALENGAVYALQVGVADAHAGSALISAMVHVTDKGTEVLIRSPLSARR